MSSADSVRCRWFEHGTRVRSDRPVEFRGCRSTMRSLGWSAATASNATSGRARHPVPLDSGVRSGGAIPAPGDRAFVAAGRTGSPTLLPSVPARPAAGRGGAGPEAGDMPGLPAGAGRMRTVSPAIRRRPPTGAAGVPVVRAGCRGYRSRRRGVPRVGADPRQRSREGDARQFAGRTGVCCTSAREPF